LIILVFGFLLLTIWKSPSEIEKMAVFIPKDTDSIVKAPDVYPKFRMTAEMKQLLDQLKK